ncbi:MAG: DUF6779 domain-containing protein [Mycobacteriaceae bacterium]
MTPSARTGRARRGSRAPAELLLGVLVALAVGGSLVMVFSSSAQLLRLAVVALLWVAVICSIAVTKYRRDASTSASRAHELQKVYALELEREVNARREHELVVESDMREQVAAQLRSGATDELAGLREEVKALRESLTSLFNGDMVVERVALRAESTRIRSLSDNSGMGASTQKLLGFPDIGGFVDIEPDDHVEPEQYVEVEHHVEPEQPAPHVEPAPPAPPAPRVEPSHRAEPEEPSAHEAAPSSAGPEPEAGGSGTKRTVSELLAAYGGQPPSGGRRRRR